VPECFSSYISLKELTIFERLLKFFQAPAVTLTRNPRKTANLLGAAVSINHHGLEAAFFVAFAGGAFTAAFFTAVFFTGAGDASAALAFWRRHLFFVAAIMRFIPSALIFRFAFGASGVTGEGGGSLTRTETPLARHTAENVFSRLRVRAGVLRHDGGRYQPRLHDLRHAFAVHRLVSWYRQGADVQRLLPQLATYLGHVHIAATQRYLTLTPDLLREASQRFERYAREGQHE
jgi:hypothetical protein